MTVTLSVWVSSWVYIRLLFCLLVWYSLEDISWPLLSIFFFIRDIEVEPKCEGDSLWRLLKSAFIVHYFQSWTYPDVLRQMRKCVYNVKWRKDTSITWKLAKFDSVDDIRSGCQIACQHQHLFLRNSLTKYQITIPYHFQTRFNFTKITYRVLHNYGHFSIQPSISLLSWSCKHDAISVEHVKPVYGRSVHVIIKFQTRHRSNDGIWWWE